MAIELTRYHVTTTSDRSYKIIKKKSTNSFQEDESGNYVKIDVVKGKIYLP